MREIEPLQHFGFVVRNIDAVDSLRENVATDSNRTQRGKLLERKRHYCVSYKPQNPKTKSQKKSKSPNLRKESKRVLNWDLGIVWDLELGNLRFTSNTKCGFFQPEFAARYRHAVLVFLPRRRRCQYNRSSFSWRAAPGWQTIRCRYSARLWPGRIPRGRNCIRK